MYQSLKNIYNLGVKELRGLLRDVFLMALIIYTFSLEVKSTYDSSTDTINNAAIAVVDEDHSQISERLVEAILPPYFLQPVAITRPEIDANLDNGKYTFVLVIPNNFQKDLEAGLNPELQLNCDATRMTQAFTGSDYLNQIFSKEITNFTQKSGGVQDPVQLVMRNKYNPNLTTAWTDVVDHIINTITLLAIILTGSALIRERERGTLEHLLVMPVTAFQIMASKIWSMALVILTAAVFSHLFIVHLYLGVPTQGSFLLFTFGIALHLFAMTSMGIFLACIATNMPQLGMLLILVLIPLQMLSGGETPQESMPVMIQRIMLFAPTTHFVKFSQAILYRGADITTVYKPFLWLFGIGSVLFAYSLHTFKKSLNNS